MADRQRVVAAAAGVVTILDTSPVRQGEIERSGQRIRWEEFGAGDRTVLLLPTWSIVHSDHWRHQVPFLAADRRVIVFDGLGNGSSDRPVDPGLYGDILFADDAVGVLDACQVGRATVMGASQGGCWALALAARRPDRVSSVVFIAPNVPHQPVNMSTTDVAMAIVARNDANEQESVEPYDPTSE